MIRFCWAALTLLLLSGCVRREGRNSDCQWPGAEAGAGRRDLIADLEFAEELAIRYMDAHRGPGDPKAAAEAKNRCMGILLEELGKEHGLSAQEAFAFFGRRSGMADAVTILPFVAVFAILANFAIGRLWRRYPPEDGWLPLLVMLVLASVAFGAMGLMLGQQWSGLAESLRVGSGHLSNRGARLPLNRYPTEAFALATVLFLGIAIARCRVRHRPRASGRNHGVTGRMPSTYDEWL